MLDYNPNIKDLVQLILEDHPETRADDMRLVSQYIKTTVKEDDKNYAFKMRLADVLCKWRELGLPNIQTIVRARRKIQVENPFLIDIASEKRRRAAELEYREAYGRKKETKS